MRKSYKFQKRKVEQKKYACNAQIKSLRLAVIDETGSPLGEMDTATALSLAEERGYDLVEVAPNANPPVAKFLNYGSFQYRKEKELKKQKALNKNITVKSVRISMKIGDHDLATRVNQANKFLEKGHKVKVEMILKGRQMQYIDSAKKELADFKNKLEKPTTVEQEVTKQGYKLFTILMPVKQAEK